MLWRCDTFFVSIIFASFLRSGQIDVKAILSNFVRLSLNKFERYLDLINFIVEKIDSKTYIFPKIDIDFSM